jgi:dTDP-4-dehydrorhamnose reductase
MRVLILGGEGMLGHKVFQVLSERFKTFATFRSFNGLWRDYPVYANIDPNRTIGGVDAMDFDTVIRAFARVKPDVVINCVGIIKQLKEAKDPLISINLNSLFPHRLIELCAATGTRMLHMGTDCVFSGRKGNYTEDDVADAEDLYGRTKLLGEVNRKGCLTVRTSIFGRDFAKQSALLEWFLSNRGGRVRGYVNAIYTGFPTQVLARIMGDLIAGYPHLSGLYHVSSEPISKYDLLVRIRDAMGLDIEIEPYEDFYCDRSLDSSRFRAETGYPIPGWDEMIAELTQDDTPYDEWRERYATA